MRVKLVPWCLQVQRLAPSTNSFRIRLTPFAITLQRPKRTQPPLPLLILTRFELSSVLVDTSIVGRDLVAFFTGLLVDCGVPARRPHLRSSFTKCRSSMFHSRTNSWEVHAANMLNITSN